MFIYKITNIINGKIYIGQTSKSIKERMYMHINKSEHKIYREKQAIDMAIYKYGIENFIIEQIDTANNKGELSQKEKYWISFYNSNNNKIGYNLTSGGEGGDTYANKTPKEMDKIRLKISKANTGRTNGMARPIKIVNVETNEIKIFETMQKCKDFFNLKGHFPILSRCRGDKRPYKGWFISWEDENYHNYDQGVSTIPDECKEVGSEMSTDPKLGASNIMDEDIVSAFGNKG